MISKLDKRRYNFFSSRDDLVWPKQESIFTIVSKKYTHERYIHTLKNTTSSGLSINDDLVTEPSKWIYHTKHRSINAGLIKRRDWLESLIAK